MFLQIMQNFQPNLGFINQKHGFKICELLCFTPIFLIKIQKSHDAPKNYKIIIENVFNQPELFCVINEH